MLRSEAEARGREARAASFFLEERTAPSAPVQPGGHARSHSSRMMFSIGRSVPTCRARCAAVGQRDRRVQLNFAARPQRLQQRRSVVVLATQSEERLPEDDPRMILRISQGTSFMGLLAARREGKSHRPPALANIISVSSMSIRC